jgi:DNA-binding IclR family transcriptional regulator
MRSARVTRKYGLSPASVSRALQALQEREILRMDESLGRTKLRLINPFFGAWIEMVSRF